MTHFSLCTGIGGIDLAAEWAGFKTIAQAETEKYASKVLAKNFPGVPNFGDIRNITKLSIRAAGIEPGSVTAVSAGFPCQPHSLVGKRKASCDERDIWESVCRAISIIDPVWFVAENVPGLLSSEEGQFFGRVLRDLSALGFNVTWGIIGASAAGAMHIRKRIFILAYSAGKRQRDMAESEQKRCTYIHFPHVEPREIQKTAEIDRVIDAFRLLPEPRRGVIRNDNGISAGLDRIKCLGNAVVPQQIYPIFKEIAEIERGLK